MKILLLTLGLLVLAVLALAWMLPSERSATKKAILKAKPSDVFEKVTNLSHQTWRSHIREVQILDATPGREVWLEKPTQGPELKFRTKAKISPSRFEIEIIDNPQFGGHWVGTFTARGEHETEVEFSEHVLVSGMLPKLLSYAFFNVEASVATYIEDLKKSLEK